MKFQFAEIKNERGAALITAMILLLVLTVIGVAAMTTSNIEIMIAGALKKKNAAFYTAEAGIDHARAFIAEEMSANDNNIPIWNSDLLDGTKSVSAATGFTYDEAAVLLENTLGKYSYTVRIWNNVDGTDPTVDNDGTIYIRSDGQGTDGSRASIMIEYIGSADAGTSSSEDVLDQSQGAQLGGGEDKAHTSNDAEAMDASDFANKKEISVN